MWKDRRSLYIDIGTGGATGAMAPSLFSQIIIKIFPFFPKHNFYTEMIHLDEESTNLRRNPSWRSIDLVFTRDEIEVLLAPSLWVTFLRP